MLSDDEIRDTGRWAAQQAAMRPGEKPLSQRIADLAGELLAVRTRAAAAVEFHRARCSQPTDAEVVRVIRAVVWGEEGES